MANDRGGTDNISVVLWRAWKSSRRPRVGTSGGLPEPGAAYLVGRLPRQTCCGQSPDWKRMLRVTIRAEGREQVVEHAGGPLIRPRSARDAPRCVLTDPFASRDHLRVEMLSDGRLRLENLSHTSAVRAAQRSRNPRRRDHRRQSLRVRFSLG